MKDISIFILCMVSSIISLSVEAWVEPEWIGQARKAKIECEENVPRKEVCVAVFLPRSKD